MSIKRELQKLEESKDPRLNDPRIKEYYGKMKRWDDILESDCFDKITDRHRKNVTAQLLENQFTEMKNTNPAAAQLMEAQGVLGTQLGTLANNSAATTTLGIDSYDPILINLVRRAAPHLMAYDICGVQPLTGPTGLIFALRAKYGGANDSTGARSSTEAFFTEADSAYSGDQTKFQGGTMADLFGEDYDSSSSTDKIFEAGTSMPTTTAERLATNGVSPYAMKEMSFTIEKTGVTAGSRALKAEYTTEMAQDLKAVHGLDAESELANILSTEIMFEINREVVRTIYDVAKLGCQQTDLTSYTSKPLGGTTRGGVYDLETDSDGRWSAEKFRGLQFQIGRESNVIGYETRRGKGNIIICSPDIAMAFSMSGILDFSPVFNPGMTVDQNSATFAGTIGNGQLRVYIDPYAVVTGFNFVCIGYKGSNAYDAGLFYCPYVPLQMMRAVDPNTFQPKIGFKTRYGMVSNPFVYKDAPTRTQPDAQTLQRRTNQYYRIFRVDNIHGNDATLN